MAGGGGALNLSLLSRGVGEVSRNGQEKIDVIFEPQDYFNFVDDPTRRFYLPPLQPCFACEHGEEEPRFSSTRSRELKEVNLPKTFTTRKGALLLFSEDLAQRTRARRHIRRRRHRHHHDEDSETAVSRSTNDVDLKTVDDLAKSILKYGCAELEDDTSDESVYLKFVHGRKYGRGDFERQIRPGFSAKRYLSTWTKCWDDSILEKVITKGYLTEKSLFYYNPLNPQLQRRLNDDMSHYPAPYKLMRSMLMSPGSLSGYTFYRVRPESQESFLDESGEDGHPGTHTSIKVISTKDGVQREVTYASLDKKAQEDVLTDLLVKSAVHYAIEKQKELLEDSLARVMESNMIQEESEGTTLEESPVPEFNMKEAVESLLVSKKGPPVVDVVEVTDDNRSDHGRPKLSSRTPRGRSGEQAYAVPVVTIRDSNQDNRFSGLPPLPPISQTQLQPMTPIGETSREQTAHMVLPPIGQDGVPMVNVQPPTPQHSTLTNPPAGHGDVMSRDSGLAPSREEEEEDQEEWGASVKEADIIQKAKKDAEDKKKKDEEKRLQKKGSQRSVVSLDLDNQGPVTAGGAHLQGSSESLGQASVQSMPPGKTRTHWKGSQQSLKSVGSKRGPGSSIEDGSVKGSVVCAPDGEIVNVGGAIQPSSKDSASIHDVLDANKFASKDGTSDESEAEEPDEWRRSQRRSSRSSRHAESLKKGLSKRDSFPRDPPCRPYSADGGRRGAEEFLASIGFPGTPPNTADKETIRNMAIIDNRHKKGVSTVAELTEPAGSMNSLSTSSRSSRNSSQRPRTGFGADLQLSPLEGFCSTPRDTKDVIAAMVDRKIPLSRIKTQSNESLSKEGELLYNSGELTPHYSPKGSGSKMSSVRTTPRSQLSQASSRYLSLSLSAAGNVPMPVSARGSAHSQVSEQELVTALTEHAQKIASSVLSQDEAGRDLETDVRQAAEIWMERHPPRQISRSQSVQENPNTTVVQEVMNAQKRKSAGPTVAEYRDLIRDNLTTAVANAAGLDKEDLPQDAELSPELIEALRANEGISPEDIEVVKDEETGKSVIRSKSQMSQRMGGVKEGHIYVPVVPSESGDTSEHSGKPAPSVPSERAANVDVGELDIINYGVVEKAPTPVEEAAKSEVASEKAKSAKSETETAPSEPVKSPPRSVKADSVIEEPATGEVIPDDSSRKKSGKSAAGKSQVSFKDEVEEKPTESPDLKKTVQALEKQAESPTKSEDLRSVKSDASKKSDDKKSKASDKSAKPKLEEREEFVVGKVENKDIIKAFGGPAQPPPPQKPEPVKGKPKEKKAAKPPPAPKKAEGKKAKAKPKGKKKKEVEEPPPEAAGEVSPRKEPTPSPEKPAPPVVEPEPEREATPKSVKSDDMEFEFVRDRSPSPSPEPEPQKARSTAPSVISPGSDEEEDTSEMDEEAQLRMISNKEARAAKRAAQAEKRKQEVERRRKEREEQSRKEKEDAERAEKLKQEMEEERRRQEEERRLRKQIAEDEERKLLEEEEARERKRLQEIEREKRMKEDYQRKLEEMKKKQAEEDLARQEANRLKEIEEEERRKQEEEMLAQMAEQERLEYEKKKKLEEEERLRREEEEKKRREEEAQLAMEEAKRLAEEMARKQAELEARLKFNRTLHLESNGLSHTQDISEAFIFSYFELLQWLGLDIPEFELMKLKNF